MMKSELLTSSLGLQQKGVAIVPEEHTSIRKLINGPHMSLQAIIVGERC